MRSGAVAAVITGDEVVDVAGEGETADGISIASRGSGVLVDMSTSCHPLPLPSPPPVAPDPAVAVDGTGTPSSRTASASTAPARARGATRITTRVAPHSIAIFSIARVGEVGGE